MSIIGSVGFTLPEYHLNQNNVVELIQRIFPNERKIDKLASIFHNAKVDNRQFVVNKDWFLKDHSFKEKNDLYIECSTSLSVKAIDHCLTNNLFLNEPIPYEAIDAIIYVSSTGISTPSIDAHIINERPFREDIVRMPLWGLGCAGGAIGLARATDYVKAHPHKNVLIVCCELCSLTFQKTDTRMSNLVGTAIFGDGVSATVLVGNESKHLSHLKKGHLSVVKSSSYTKKESLSIMGWDVTDIGLHVIFSKRIPSLVKSLWKNHVKSFLNSSKITLKDIDTFIAHPGGRKVLEEMESSLSINRSQLSESYSVLRQHGNMSSATVFYVLHEWLKNVNSHHKSNNIICALGPGFSSELLLLEWADK